MHIRRMSRERLSLLCRRKEWRFEPKTRKSHPKKINSDALILDVENFPDSTLKQRGARFGASAPAIRKRLVALGITQKKRRRFIAGATNSTAGSLSGISKS